MGTWQTDSFSLKDTWRIAGRIGQRLRGGEVIELVSDLGGGKTAFVHGLVKGAGSTDRVSSPSFTLRNEYRAGKLTVYHFDFYRLDEAGIMRDELAETLAEPQAVSVIEWADIVEDVLPAQRLTVRLTATGEESRQFDFRYPASLHYLLEWKG
jgi:tRNA threonylcarbamoyladenosine biosynthesis protein TsaE